MGIEVTIDNRQRRYPVDRTTMRHWATAVLSMQKETSVTVGIILVNDQIIRQFNRQYRGLDVPTDVLSFPTIDHDLIPRKNPRGGLGEPPVLLGDVMISLERADAESSSYGKKYSGQVLFLLIHGLLHLLGYDHERSKNEAIRMQRREKFLFRKIYITE